MRIQTRGAQAIMLLAPLLCLGPGAVQSASPSPSATAGGDVCRVGARVTDRRNASGTVVEAKGSDCRVKLDDGSLRYYLAWMLKPAGSNAAGADPATGGGALAKGRYDCWAAAGVAGTMKLEIRSDSTYAGNGKAGSYAYDATTRKIVFQSGPWGGFFGGRLGNGKIGISSRRGGSYNTVCDLKS